MKGVEVIGIGSDNFRKVPVDEDYRIITDELQRMIAEDKAAGYIPFCIVGNAGTVNTGAIDPLNELSAIAKEHNLWLHVDGAFGAIPNLLPEFAGQLKGLELADSLSFDFHKWMYVNYEAACVLIRDPQLHREAFAYAVNYLMVHERGLSAGPDGYNNYGMELSRGFKALKIWMSIKQNGLETYRTPYKAEPAAGTIPCRVGAGRTIARVNGAGAIEHCLFPVQPRQQFYQRPE